MSTATETDQSILEVIDLEERLKDEVPCANEDGCSRAAAWAGRQPCCGFRANLCDEHKTSWDEYFAWATRVVGGVICEQCGASPMPTPEWWEL